MLELAAHVHGARAGLRLVAAWCSRCTTSRSRASRATGWRRRSSDKYLRESSSSKQLLIASITSEVGMWGDTRSSICAVERDGERFKLDKDATTVSYGEHADACSSRAAATPTRRRAIRCSCSCARPTTRSTQTGDVGHDGHARHVQPGLQDRRRRGAEEQIAAGLVRRRVGADDGARTRTSCGRRVWLGIAADAVGARARRSCAPRRARSPAPCRRKAIRLARLSVELQPMRNNVHGQARRVRRDHVAPDGHGGAAHRSAGRSR